MFVRICIAVGLAVLGFSAQAFTVSPLATITNDRNKDVSHISTAFDGSQALVGLLFQTRHADTGKETSDEFSIAQISAGAVLDGDASHKVFILQGDIDGNKATNTLTVKYLSNGLTGSYDSCKVNLSKVDNHWAMVNYYDHKTITSIVVRTWALGIANVENVCPPNHALGEDAVDEADPLNESGSDL